MNQLVIIGNGFDLAHGLETSYQSFIFSFLKGILKVVIEKNGFDDHFLTIKIITPGVTLDPDSFHEVKEITNCPYISIIFKHPFLNKIMLDIADLKWVDIEYEYYSELCNLYKNFEQYSDKKVLRSNVDELNKCFDYLKTNLIIHIKNINIGVNLLNYSTKEIFNKNIFSYNDESNILFINFNYTTLIDYYIRILNPPDKNNIDLVNIHGSVQNERKNPIIFGYGDELDPFYQKIEQTNINALLSNIKSFFYCKTNNYKKIISFIESDIYYVHILGHSCGISDRVLLSTIFENKYCNGIKIYHHCKNQEETDYFEKTQEISRHFKPEKKERMRILIKSFDVQDYIPQVNS